MPDELTALVDRYLAASADLKHLEEQREALRDAILAAAGPAPREIAGAMGAVRVGVTASCRFEPAPVVAALERAGLLAAVATVTGPRLRRAMHEAPGVAHAVGHLVDPVDTPTVAAVPARLRWTGPRVWAERLRARGAAP